MNNLNRIGKVKDAFGIKGDLYVIVFSKQADWLENLKFCFLQNPTTNEIAKHKVLSAKQHKDGFTLKLENFQNRNQSEAVKGFYFLMEQEFFTSNKGEPVYLIELMGFEAFDNDIRIGKVVGFSSNLAQDLFEIESSTAVRFLVPFVEAFVKKIDYQQKQIFFDLPEGLIDVQTKP